MANKVQKINLLTGKQHSAVSLTSFDMSTSRGEAVSIGDSLVPVVVSVSMI